jgi:hypothetical protein
MDCEEDESYDDRFQNPDAFLSRFGGYESEHSEDPDENEHEEQQRCRNKPKFGKCVL